MKRHINRFSSSAVAAAGALQISRREESKSAAKLPFPDDHYLSAAQGWLGLGSWKEATEELSNISFESWEHPNVLETRYQVHAVGQNWPDALIVCKIITQKMPEQAFGWLYLSLVLNEMTQTKDAYETIFRVLHRFPKDPLMRYSMACYSCKLGLLSEASVWLRRSFELGDAHQLMSAALTDADLKPMWSRMGVEPMKK